MQKLNYFILYLCIILFSGLGISLYKEGLNCSKDQVDKNGVCVTPNKQNDNTVIVIIILIIIIVWIFMIR